MEIVRLPSGRDVVIRPIRPTDGPELQAAHERLSARTRYLRFLAVKPHLNTHETRYLVSVDGHDHVALVAAAADDPDRIIAVARWVRLTDEPDTAEFAIVIDDEFQHDGLGSALMLELARTATACGVCRFRATVLAENVAMHRLIHRLPYPVVRQAHDGATDEIDLDLVPADALAA